MPGRFIRSRASMPRQPQPHTAQSLPETCSAFDAVNDLVGNHPDQHAPKRKVGDTSRGNGVKVKGIVVSAIFPHTVIGRRGGIRSAGGNSGNTAAQSRFANSIPGTDFRSSLPPNYPASGTVQVNRRGGIRVRGGGWRGRGRLGRRGRGSCRCRRRRGRFGGRRGGRGCRRRGWRGRGGAKDRRG